MVHKQLLCLLAVVAYVSGVAINNGVVGPPEIQCLAHEIQVNFNVQNNFEGSVYVKGRFAEEDCKDVTGQGRQVAGITLKYDTCGTQRTRSLNPRGVFITNTVIITFHPNFLTKIDQAYRIQCFYMEADKTVSQELEVSMLTTAFHTDQVLMPVCRYEIHDGNADGPIINYALVGQQVYHRWVCDTETERTFCMSVYSCFVDDGAGNKVDLIDEEGCAIDKYLLNNIEYTKDLEGGVQAHVFKYADKPKLFFNCQIRIAVKDPTETQEDCSDSPIRKQCPEPAGRGGPARKKRAAKISDEEYNVLDVRADFNALDLDDKLEALPVDVTHNAPRPLFHHRYPTTVEKVESSGICVSSTALFAFLALAVALAAAVVTVASCLMVRRNEKA